jgi:colicin import membrane protein
MPVSPSKYDKRRRQKRWSKTGVLFLALAALAAAIAGYFAWGAKKELEEWRALREKKAAKKAAKDAAAAAKKREEEEAAKRREAAATAEVTRVLACPARVTEEASKAAEAAKAAGEPKPRKDLSAVHRCVLGLGPYADGAGGGGAEGADGVAPGAPCEVCARFLAPIAEALKVEMAGKPSGDAAATAADRLLGQACASAELAGDGRPAREDVRARGAQGPACVRDQGCEGGRRLRGRVRRRRRGRRVQASVADGAPGQAPREVLGQGQRGVPRAQGGARPL